MGKLQDVLEEAGIGMGAAVGGLRAGGSQQHPTHTQPKLGPLHWPVEQVCVWWGGRLAEDASKELPAGSLEPHGLSSCLGICPFI